MPNSKNADLRARVIGRCLSDKNRRCTMVEQQFLSFGENMKSLNRNGFGRRQGWGWEGIGKAWGIGSVWVNVKVVILHRQKQEQGYESKRSTN